MKWFILFEVVVFNDFNFSSVFHVQIVDNGNDKREFIRTYRTVDWKERQKGKKRRKEEKMQDS